MTTFTTYLGVRVSEREAGLLKIGMEAAEHGYVLPARLALKITAIENAVDRFRNYEIAALLVDRRAQR